MPEILPFLVHAQQRCNRFETPLSLANLAPLKYIPVSFPQFPKGHSEHDKLLKLNDKLGLEALNKSPDRNLDQHPCQRLLNLD
jgi:hypothetical protein